MTTPQTDNIEIYQKTNTSKLKNILIVILALLLTGLGFYTFSSARQSDAKLLKQEMRLAEIAEDKSQVQQQFDASLARLDSMTTSNGNLQAQLADKNGEIAKMKTEIRNILNKKNSTTAELKQARLIIDELNGKITAIEAQIAKLTEDNKLLIEEKAVLIQEKNKLTEDLKVSHNNTAALEKKVEIASTLQASNIRVTPIDIKGNGKEKVSEKAKKVDKLLISFDVDNRIAEAGQTDVYVLITDPNGEAIMPDTAALQTFETRQEGQKTYTAKLSINIETAQRKNVEFGFKPGARFKEGNYKVKIYQNGFLIGETTTALRKGGLFG